MILRRLYFSYQYFSKKTIKSLLAKSVSMVYLSYDCLNYSKKPIKRDVLILLIYIRFDRIESQRNIM
jgi:hypothetical protein